MQLCGGHLTHILAEMMNMMALTSFAHIMAASFESSKIPPNGKNQVLVRYYGYKDIYHVSKVLNFRP